MELPREGGPRVHVEPLQPAPRRMPAHWNVAWRVENQGDRPLEIEAAWLPHGRFHAAEQVLEPPPRVLPGESARLAFAVRCAEPPGTVVENAFVIMRARWGDEPWRILARLLVTVDARGAPTNTVEVITAHPIGFSRPPGG